MYKVAILVHFVMSSGKPELSLNQSMGWLRSVGSIE